MPAKITLKNNKWYDTEFYDFGLMRKEKMLYQFHTT
jgi:hypothetical protein